MGNIWHFFGTVGENKNKKEPPFPGHDISIAHATSEDLYSWTIHDDVLECLGVWPETTHIFAPFVIEYIDKYYMFYGVTDKEYTQRICLATSENLFDWKRYPDNPVIVPSLFWSKWPGFGLDQPDEGSYGGCRDPHIIRLSDGTFVSYWVSRIQEKFGHDMVCVAASISKDMIHWQEIGPVFSSKAWYQPLTMEVESPCVILKDSFFWLFYKQGWWTHFSRSNSPFDFQGCEPVRLGYAHAAEIFFWNDKWWITHCKTDPEDYSQSDSDSSRGLFITNLDWEDKKYPSF